MAFVIKKKKEKKEYTPWQWQQQIPANQVKHNMYGKWRRKKAAAEAKTEKKTFYFDCMAMLLISNSSRKSYGVSLV